jgi:hypothetical protein
MKFLLVYTTISVIGLNAKGEEVVTYDLVSRMVDLEVELAPELTKGSRTSASTSAFFSSHSCDYDARRTQRICGGGDLAQPASLANLGFLNEATA